MATLQETLASIQANLETLTQETASLTQQLDDLKQQVDDYERAFVASGMAWSRLKETLDTLIGSGTGNPPPPPPTGGDTVTYRPALIDLNTEIDNPLRGAQYYGGGAPPPGYPLADRHLRFSWRRIEPSPGNFDFSIIDQGIERARATGYKFGWRVMPVNNGKDVPDGIPGTMQGSRFIPDWNSQAYLDAVQRIVNALAARYANNPHVGLLDMSFYGCWGEWNESCYGGPGASYETRKRIIDMQYAAFPQKQFVMLTSWRDSLQYALSVERAKPTGVRIDCLGHTGLGGGYIVPDRWKVAPLYFEYCGGPDFQVGLNDVIRYHASIVGDGDGNLGNFGSYNSQDQQLLLQSFLRSGYRFATTQITTPSRYVRDRAIQIQTTWRNINSAPSYIKWRVTWQLRSGTDVKYEAASTVDLTQVFGEQAGGETVVTDEFAVPASVPAGAYQLALIARDPEAVYRPLKLAQQGRQADGAYLIGPVTVA